MIVSLHTPLMAALLAVESLHPIADNHARRAGAFDQPAKTPLTFTWKLQAYGLEGTVVEDMSHQRWRKHFNIPAVPVSETMVMEQGAVLEQDTNGRIITLAGPSRAERITWHAILSGRWFMDNAAVRSLPPDEQRRTRLEVTPKGGMPAQLTFSTDGDLTEFTTVVAGQPASCALSDYGPLGSFRVARRREIHSRSAQTPEVWTLQGVERFADAPFPKLVERVDWRLPSGRAWASTLMTMYLGRWPTIPVRLGGEWFTFLVDTGASSTVLNLSTAKKLNLDTKGAIALPAGIFAGVFFVRSPDIEVASIHLDPQTVVAVNLNRGSFGAAFPDLGGILGYDFLSRFVVVFDYPASRIDLHAPTSFKPGADDVAIPASMDGRALVVPVDVNGQRSSFVLDTGNGGELVVQHVQGQRAWVTKEQERFYDPEGQSFGSGKAGSWRSRIDLKVGPFVWTRAPAAIVDEATAQGTSLRFDGNLGADFLQHFRVTVDMSTPRVWLSQRVPFRQRHGAATYGLGISQKGPNGVVHRMDKDGPAVRAGLRVGDEVLLVNGVAPVQGGAFLRMYTLSDPMPGEQVRIRLRRNGQEQDVTVTAESLP